MPFFSSDKENTHRNAVNKFVNIYACRHIYRHKTKIKQTPTDQNQSRCPLYLPAIMMEKVSMSAAPEPFLSEADRGTSCRPTLRLNTMPSFNLTENCFIVQKNKTRMTACVVFLCVCFANNTQQFFCRHSSFGFFQSTQHENFLYCVCVCACARACSNTRRHIFTAVLGGFNTHSMRTLFACVCVCALCHTTSNSSFTNSHGYNINIHSTDT